MRLGKVGFLILLWAVLAALRVWVALLPTAGTWEPAGRPAATVDAMAMDGSRLLAGGQTGVFESFDGGTTWSAVPELKGHAITALAVGGGQAFAAGPGAAWLERNGRWAFLAALPEGAVRHLGVQGNRVLAATETGLFALDMDGSVVSGHLERLWPAPGQEPAPVHAVAVAGEQLLVGTSDGVVEVDGHSPEGKRLGPAGARVLDIVTGTRWVHIAVAGPKGGLARATLGSAEWQWGTVDAEYATSVLLDPRDESHLYAGLGGQATDRYVSGVVESMDGGLNWASVKNRLQNSFVPSIALDAAHETLFAGTLGGGVYRYRAVTAAHSIGAMARPLLELADPLLLGLAALTLLVHLRPRLLSRPEPGSPRAT